MDIASPKTPEALNNTAIKRSAFGRGRLKGIRDRASLNSPQTSPDNNLTPGNNIGPLTIKATNRTDREVDGAIEDAKSVDQKVFIRDENSKVFTDNKTNQSTFEDNLENSELDLASNLNSGTEIEIEEKEPIRRSKRLTKPNPIVRYSSPVCNDYRAYRKRLNSGAITRQSSDVTGSQPPQHQTPGQWRNIRHSRMQNAPIGRSSANRRGL